MVEFRRIERGFTIVELLIVIVVIGILAAMVIVAYSGVTGRANDEAVKSNLEGYAKQLALYEAANGAYPATVNDFLNSSGGVKASKGSYNTSINFNFLVCMGSGATTFAIIAESSTTNRFYVSNSSQTPTATSQALYDPVNGTSAVCGALGAPPGDRLYMWMSGWNSKVGS